MRTDSQPDMILYRIAHELHADLNGVGGLTNKGRWNHKGAPLVYLSEHISLCAWEKLVQFESINNIPDIYVCLTVEVPDDSLTILSKEILDRDFKQWDTYPHSLKTMDFGSNFLKENETLLLQVPSIVVPSEYNFLFNPLHPKSKTAKIINIEPFVFDGRLKKMK